MCTWAFHYRKEKVQFTTNTSLGFQKSRRTLLTVTDLHSLQTEHINIRESEIVTSVVKIWWVLRETGVVFVAVIMVLSCTFGWFIGWLVDWPIPHSEIVYTIEIEIISNS